MTVICSIVRFLIVCGGLFGSLMGLSIGNSIVTFTFVLCVVLSLPSDFLQQWRAAFVTLFIVAAWRLAYLWFSGAAAIELPLYEFIPCWLLLLFIVLGMIRKSSLRILLWFFAIVSLGRCAYWASQNYTINEKDKVAYLERGKWGITHVEQHALNIQSQYSYSLLKRALGATTIDNLNDINRFDELWMTTPTIPFTDGEHEKLIEWVERGGRLILITDHTDLYGHATVLNQLIGPIGIRIGKDCVIRDSGQVPYMSLLGSFLGLTANTIQGNCWPALLQVGFCERAEYSGKGFFSDNAVTDEDIAGVYCAGATRRYGHGAVMIFGDSTLFADFALSRPSAQIALRIFRDGVAIVNFPLLYVLLLVAWLCLETRRRVGSVLAGGLLFLLMVYCAYSIQSTMFKLDIPLFPDGDIATVRVYGEFDLVDRDGEKLSTLFSTLFAMPVAFPEWRGFVGGSGVTYDNVSLNVSDAVAKPLLHRGLSDVLADIPMLSAREFEEQLVSLAGSDGMWFDSGIGLMKTVAYSNFWNNVCHKQSKHFCLGDSQIVSNVLYYVAGNTKTNSVIRKTRITGERDWCIIGDWLIGKQVGKNVLIREKWQHPSRRYGDMVIELDTVMAQDL